MFGWATETVAPVFAFVVSLGSLNQTGFTIPSRTILDSTNQAGLNQPSWDQPIFFSTYLGEISGARSELVVFRFTEPFCLSCILNDIPWQPFFSKYQYCSHMTKERWRTRTLWILKGNLCQLQKFAQLIHCWCICFIQSNIVQMQHKYTMYVVQI